MATAQQRERILSRPIVEEMKESFLDYSMSVIVQRALPDVRDGLKPVHRRILYAMHELGLDPDKAYKKSATVVGDVLGKFHPHGDSAVYDSMVRMVQEFSLRYPLVDGQGNFGSIDGDSAAAYRYTEARLAPLATDLLLDIELETVDFQPNFDGRLEEPIVLPSRAPNLLINGSSGIAVGMSTNIPPHNLREVAAALRVLANDPECSVDDLMRHVKGPDFPTGGFVIGTDGIEKMYRTGRGRIVMRGRIVKEALRGGKSQLVVTELPYAISKSKIIDQIVTAARKGQLDDVSDVRDESDREGIRIVIELKRGTDANSVLRILHKRTYLQSTFGAILLSLDHGQPAEMNLKEILEKWRDHRIEVVQRRSRHLLEKAEAERHVVEGLLAALDAIDEVIRIIRGSDDRAEASEKLQDALGLSEIQATAILDMRLARLTKLQKSELEARLRRLKSEIRDLRAILKSDEKQLEVVLEELAEVVDTYGDERRTVVLADAHEEIPEVQEEVADENAVVTVSHEGYAKRMPMHLYRRRVNSGKALAGMEKYDDDFIERIFVARTTGYVLAFTEQGQVHPLEVIDLPESGRASRGQSLYALLPGADRDDPIVAVLPIESLEEQDEDAVFVFLSEGGLVKRTQLAEFTNVRSTGLIAAGTRDGDRILDVALSDGASEVIVFSREGFAIRFPESDVPAQGRTATGVKSISLEKGGAVVGMLLVRREADVLMVHEDGTGKRTTVSEFPLQKRGGKGTQITPSKGPGSRKKSPLVNALEVGADDTVMVVTAGGQVQRLAVGGVPVQGRRTAGRKIATVPKGGRVVEVARSAESAAASRSGVGSDGAVEVAAPPSEPDADLDTVPGSTPEPTATADAPTPTSEPAARRPEDGGDQLALLDD
jgi:DNA gyrase subunit A